MWSIIICNLAIPRIEKESYREEINDDLNSSRGLIGRAAAAGRGPWLKSGNYGVKGSTPDDGHEGATNDHLRFLRARAGVPSNDATPRLRSG
jgi:hypothetical protein